MDINNDAAYIYWLVPMWTWNDLLKRTNTQRGTDRDAAYWFAHTLRKMSRTRIYRRTSTVVQILYCPNWD